MLRSWKREFVIARPNSEQRGLSDTATIHAANTMMTNHALPHIMVSAAFCIATDKQYDFLVSRDHWD